MKKFVPLCVLTLFFISCAKEEASCPEAELACGVSCVNPETDPTNCGGCGISCGEGELCIGAACACPEGGCVEGPADLFATCFQGGQMIPFLKAHQAQSGKPFSGMEGPQAMAALDANHVVVVGSLDQTLYVVDRHSMDSISSLVLAEEAGEAMPSHLVVRGNKAFVVNSGTNEVVAVDLADPKAPKVAYSVSTGQDSSPMAAAFDDSGTLWVSLWSESKLLPLTMGEAAGTAGEAIDVPAGVIEGIPYPAGVAATGDRVYVSLNNLDENFSPAGNGRLWIVSKESKTGEIIDLGATCKNPGLIHAAGDRVFVPCTGTYSGDGAVVVYDPGKALDAKTLAEGGAPSRLSFDATSEKLYVADGMGVDILVVGMDGSVASIRACSEREWEFVSDVLVLP